MVDLDYPVNKNASHFLIDIVLILHVPHILQILELHFLHVSQNWAQVLSHMLWIVLLLPVYLLNVSSLHLIDCDCPELVQSTIQARPLDITGMRASFTLGISLIFAQDRPTH